MSSSFARAFSASASRFTAEEAAAVAVVAAQAEVIGSLVRTQQRQAMKGTLCPELKA
jgi:hypothetical protein